MKTQHSVDPAARKVWSLEEEIERWKGEYQMLHTKKVHDEWVENLHKFRGPHHPPEGIERRSEPRLYLPEKTQIFAHIGPQAMTIHDISVGGMSFFSEFYFEPDTHVLVSAMGNIALELVIVTCDMVETDADFMEYRYKVHAKFGPLVNGYQVYMLAMEIVAQSQQDSARSD
ncbi:MAG: PilZ domain-containing protein [Candidatus Lambdaproteobacteria bacterium]|nr:PilZ domain-containing protein [Candidatus Lambdaproteobacteria bacterium]